MEKVHVQDDSIFRNRRIINYDIICSIRCSVKCSIVVVLLTS